MRRPPCRHQCSRPRLPCRPPHRTEWQITARFPLGGSTTGRAARVRPEYSNVSLAVAVKVKRLLARRCDRLTGRAADDLNIVDVHAGRGNRDVRRHSPAERDTLAVSRGGQVSDRIDVTACRRPCPSLTACDRAAEAGTDRCIIPPETHEPPAVMKSAYAPAPILISSTIPSKPDSVMYLFLN